MMELKCSMEKRTNFRDDFTSDILKMQFSFKYSFSHMFYKEAK